MRSLWTKLRTVFRHRHAIGSDLDEELTAHLEMEIEDSIARGMTPEEASVAAKRTFGNRTLIREDARAMWLFPMLEGFCADVIYGVRSMGKTPAFAVTAVLTLGLGIGANTAVFSVVRGVLLKPLSYFQPDRLVLLTLDNARHSLETFTPVRYDEIRSMNTSFEEVGAYGMPEDFTLLVGREPDSIKGIRISANFTRVLGIQPVLGRGFLPEEGRPGGPSVAIISAELWHRRFHADRSVIGKTATLDSTPYTVIGVLPENFAFPFAGLDVWLPRPSEFSMVAPADRSRTATLTGFARLKPGVSLKQARNEMEVLNRRYAESNAELADANADSVVRVEYLKDKVVANVREAIWVLFGAVSLVFLIACANIAGLLLARAASRSREFAVRSALGASRSRLVRQLFAESIVLAAAGGILGVLAAKFALGALEHINAAYLPRATAVRLDGTVLGFTIALSLLTALLFGLFPSLQASPTDLSKALRDRDEGANQTSRRSGPLGVRTRSLLVIAQIALSTVLLIGAGLLLKSFSILQSVNPGFQSGGLLTAQIALSPVRYDTKAKKAAFWDQLVQHIKTIHGVQSATAMLTLPMSPAYAVAFQTAKQALKKPSERPLAQFQSVTPGYLGTLHIPLRSGRSFTDRDNAPGAPKVVLINDSLARRFWPGYPQNENPVGQDLIFGTSTATVIGVVGDVHEYGLSSEAGLEIYAPCVLSPPQSGALAVRVTGDPRGFVEAIRRSVLSIDPTQPLSRIETMNERVQGSTIRQRTALVLIGLFAAIAMLLAIVGIYGLIAYSVVKRTPELGIRRALGAQNADILRLVIGEGLRLAIVGIVIGLAGAFGLTRTMSSLLYHVKSSDPVIFASVALTFLLVVLAATWIPALRATRIDPVKALR